MKIRTLQSLIDRTSNQIAEYESVIQWEYEHQKFCYNDFELEQNKATVKYYKAKLVKLREIQKELKTEIAYELYVKRMEKRVIGFSMEF